MDRPPHPADLNRRQELRQSQSILRAGAPPTPCFLCGYFTDMPGLMRSFRLTELPPLLRQKVLQRHHADGQAVSDYVLFVCVWCHVEETNAQYDLPPELRHPRTALEQELAEHMADARLMQRWGTMLQSRGKWREQRIRERLASFRRKEKNR